MITIHILPINAQRIQVPLRYCSWITGTLQHILPCQLMWVFTLSGYFMGTNEDSCEDSLQWSIMNWKTLLLATSSNGLFWTLSDIFSYCIQTYSLTKFWHSASCHIYLFLVSCWACTVILWLEIYVPFNKFGFSRDGCWSWTYGEILLVLLWMISSPNN